MIVEVKIPEISENVTSGKVVKVLVKKGDQVEVDDILIEFETDKALVEIPSTAKGEIVELLAQEGMDMQVGDVIAKVEPEAAGEPREEKDDASAKKEQPEKDTRAASEKPQQEDRDATEIEPSVEKPKSKKAEDKQPQQKEHRPPAPAAPSVRRFARELGVDIHMVTGSGPGGRITQDDIKAFVKQERVSGAQAPGVLPQQAAIPDFTRWGEIETTELPAVRRLTAQSTSVSWQTIPHVTQFDRADITQVEAFIRQNSPKLQKKEIKLTLTAVLTKICTKALARFPRFNASIDVANNRMIYKKYVHIGIATATERGLLVPVIRDADQKSISDLAADVMDLAQRARNKKIKPDEMEGATFTISNQGGIGGTQFTPIVMWPQAAILGVSRTAIEPVFVDGRFEPRSILPLALSYDHRIIDGADAAAFLRWICESLEQPLTMQL